MFDKQEQEPQVNRFGLADSLSMLEVELDRFAFTMKKLRSQNKLDKFRSERHNTLFTRASRVCIEVTAHTVKPLPQPVKGFQPFDRDGFNTSSDSLRHALVELRAATRDHEDDREFTDIVLGLSESVCALVLDLLVAAGLYKDGASVYAQQTINPNF